MIEKLSRELLKEIEKEMLKKEIFIEKDYYEITKVKLGEIDNLSCIIPFWCFKRYIQQTNKELEEIEKEIITKISIEECANLLNDDGYNYDESVKYYIENNNIYKKEIIFIGYKIKIKNS